MAHRFPQFEGQVPERLHWEIKRGACVLFVGAGLSRQVLRETGRPLPDWKGLLLELMDLAREDGHPVTEDIRFAIERGQLLEAGQELQEITKDSLQEYLHRIFSDPALQPSEAHLLLPMLRVRGILTTNYDSLIEDAYRRVIGKWPLTMTYIEYVTGSRDPLRNNDFFIYKVHGDYRDSKSIALGMRNYQDLTHSNPGYRFLLESLFHTYTILFAGCGGSDPDINHALDSLATKFRHQSELHYILLPRNRWTSIEKRRAREDRRLEVIEYDPAGDHVQVGSFLEQLAQGEPEQDNRLHVAIALNAHDERKVRKLLDALDSVQFRVTLFDLGRISQARWFDDLRAQIECCDIVISVMGSAEEHSQKLLGWLVAQVKSATMLVLTKDESVSPVQDRTETIAIQGEDWVAAVMRRLDLVKTPMDRGA